jgi:hypothetical protein
MKLAMGAPGSVAWHAGCSFRLDPSFDDDATSVNLVEDAGRFEEPRRQEETVRPRSSRARILASVLAAAFGLVMAAPPAFAGQLPAPRPASPAKATLAAAADARVAAMTSAEVRAVVQQEPAAQTTTSPSFFKTGKGIAVLVLMAAGVGYAAYSAVDSRDAVKSPIR